MMAETPRRLSRAPSAMPPWPPPDDDAIGLHRAAERCLVRALALEPAQAIARGAMGNPVLARHTAPLLMTLELGHRREEGPASVATQPQMTLAARDPGLEGEPRLEGAVAASVASSIRMIASCPSIVLMFQVKVRRSRQ